MTKTLVITYDNNHNFNNGSGSIQIWEKSVKKKGWEYLKLGHKNKWVGFGTKFNAIRKAMKYVIKKYGPNALVVVTDSRDVIANRSPKSLKKQFNKVRKTRKVVFSSEMGCCVDTMHAYKPGSFFKRKGGRKIFAIDNQIVNNQVDYKNEWIKHMTRNYKLHKRIRFKWFRALNAGLYCGLAKDLKSLYDKMIPVMNKENNQALFTNAMIMFKNRITIDYNNIIFSNANTWDGRKGCFFTYNKRRKMWKNTLTKSYPFFIQTPGSRQDYYYCYKKLTKEYV